MPRSYHAAKLPCREASAPPWWLLHARNLTVRDTDSEKRRKAVKRDEMFAALTSNLKAEIRSLSGRTIQETDGPRQLGGHSLKIMEAITRTMKELRIEVPRDALLRTRNLGDVLDVFEQAAGR